jgi:hypothetical protein
MPAWRCVDAKGPDAGYLRHWERPIVMDLAVAIVTHDDVSRVGVRA